MMVRATSIVSLLFLATTPGLAQKRLGSQSAKAGKNRVKGIKGTSRDLQGIDTELLDGDTGIIGGVQASSGEFPFYVKFEGGTLCGGSLINPTTVLTAAHCTDNGPPSQVRIGADQYNNGGVVVSTQCSINHPNFIENDRTLMNDVAIIKLREPVTDMGISTININTNTAYPSASGTQMTVIGFGLTNNNGNTANTLQKLNTNFVGIDECMDTYTEKVVTPQTHICGDVRNAGDCNGDSGGPVFAGSLQVGIVSFGYGGCASAQYQDVYTNVAVYSDWIKSYADGTNCRPASDESDGDGGSGTDSGTDVDTGDGDDDEASDFDGLLECFSTVLDLVQGLMGIENDGKNGGNNDNDNDNDGNKNNNDKDDNKQQNQQKGNNGGKRNRDNGFLRNFFDRVDNFLSSEEAADEIAKVLPVYGEENGGER